MKEKRGLSPRVSRAQEDQTPLVRRITRRRAWAGAFAEKFRQQVNLLDWRPEAFVHRLPARRLFLFLNHLQHFHLKQHNSLTAGPMVNRFFLQHRTLYSPVPTASQQIDAGGPRRAQNGQGAQTLLASRRREDNSLPLARVVDRLHRSHAAAGGDALAAALFQDSIQVRRRILRREIAGADAAPSEIGARIMRQLRRVEERPPAPPPDPVPGAAAMLAGSDFVLKSPRVMPVREINSRAGLDSMPSPPAPFNVMQLTDEVMRQLDRRLVAARERVGKI